MARRPCAPWMGSFVFITVACGRSDVYPGPAVALDSTGRVDDPRECSPPEVPCTIELSLQRAVDILFVIDNSGSMGGEQGKLARNFASFVSVLEGHEVGANYRIGITTTEGTGDLRATSCRSRINEFLFDSHLGSFDERQRGCLDHCLYESLAIEQPWLEKVGGTTNLPPGVEMAAALQCVGPQGINGFGIERPLLSMRRALEDASTQFVRDDALLAVIIVTDEVDCSTTNDRVDWLQTEGYPFWTTAERPTSAVCWRAGVSCVGSPDGYDDCVPVDKGFDGLDVAPGEPSVLDPVQIYIDSVSALAHEKQMRGGRGQILLALIAGVPLDYPQTQTMLFANSALQEFNVEYGIGPGCNVGTETVDDPPGIPPVRMRQLVEAFAAGENSIFSICSEDYSIALERIASAIGEINERACLAGCSVDTHANKIGVQPSCRLTEDFTDESGRIDSPVPQCVQTLDGWAFPDAAVDTCYRVLNDIEGITPSTVDDLSSQCRTLGWDAELVVERRQGIAVPAGTAVKVECDLLGPTGVACDDL